jgi:Mrp family chromosome partitioning ATPase
MSVRAETIHSEANVFQPPAEAAFSPEVFRKLYSSLDISPDSSPVIGVTSALAGEGRTTVALGLARTLAQDLDSMVWLIEADLEHPSLARRFQLPVSPGLSEVLMGDQWLGAVGCLVEPNLGVITAGSSTDNAGGLMHQLFTEDIFRGPDGLTGVLVMDLPPILPYGYSGLAARLTDILLLVVRAGVTPLHVVRESIERLEGRLP